MTCVVSRMPESVLSSWRMEVVMLSSKSAVVRARFSCVSRVNFSYAPASVCAPACICSTTRSISLAVMRVCSCALCRKLSVIAVYCCCTDASDA